MRGGPALAIGAALVADAVWADPSRFHPVAGFGRGATALERLLYRDSHLSGVAYSAAAVSVPVLATVALDRLLGRAGRLVLLTGTTWAALGGTSLVREGDQMSALLSAPDLVGARLRLTHLCARDPADLDEADLVRATVESLAENTSDAAVAPLLWAAILGAPGVVGYRAANTLDAMVGYRSSRYRRFGWAAARLDDVVNLVPARLSAALAVALAGLVGGSPAQAWRAWRRDAQQHPSPNAGHVEAAFAGALDRTLGGTNTYVGYTESRATLGDGPAPEVADIARAARLSRLVVLAAGVVAAALATGRGWRTA